MGRDRGALLRLWHPEERSPADPPERSPGVPERDASGSRSDQRRYPDDRWSRDHPGPALHETTHCPDTIEIRLRRVELCDEPTGALDLETGRVVLASLRDINRRVGRTVSAGARAGALRGLRVKTPDQLGGGRERVGEHGPVCERQRRAQVIADLRQQHRSLGKMSAVERGEIGECVGIVWVRGSNCQPTVSCQMMGAASLA
jgi:hypothetical protein